MGSGSGSGMIDCCDGSYSKGPVAATPTATITLLSDFTTAPFHTRQTRLCPTLHFKVVLSFSFLFYLFIYLFIYFPKLEFYLDPPR